MRKLLLITCTTMLYFSACSCVASAKPSTDAKKDEKKVETKKTIKPEILDGIDYAQFKMMKVGNDIITRHQKAANEELKTEAAPWRDKIRAFEQKFDVKLYDENWNRCCDEYDAVTGEIIKDGYKPPRQPPRQ